MVSITGQPSAVLRTVDLVTQAAAIGKKVMDNAINTPVRQSTIQQAAIGAQRALLARTINLQQPTFAGGRKAIKFGSVASI